MIYSQALVWKAIGEFLPSHIKARQNGINMNFPQSLKEAAIVIFLSDNIAGNPNKVFAAYVIRTALKELESVGWMEFGDVEKYW